MERESNQSPKLRYATLLLLKAETGHVLEMIRPRNLEITNLVLTENA